jgi:hypothetical protein
MQPQRRRQLPEKTTDLAIAIHSEAMKIRSSAVALGAALAREFNGPEAWGGAEEFEAY